MKHGETWRSVNMPFFLAPMQGNYGASLVKGNFFREFFGDVSDEHRTHCGWFLPLLGYILIPAVIRSPLMPQELIFSAIGHGILCQRCFVGFLLLERIIHGRHGPTVFEGSMVGEMELGPWHFDLHKSFMTNVYRVPGGEIILFLVLLHRVSSIIPHTFTSSQVAPATNNHFHLFSVYYLAFSNI